MFVQCQILISLNKILFKRITLIYKKTTLKNNEKFRIPKYFGQKFSLFKIYQCTKIPNK